MFEGFVSCRNYPLVVGGRREGEVKNKFGDLEELFTNRTHTRNRVRCLGEPLQVWTYRAGGISGPPGRRGPWLNSGTWVANSSRHPYETSPGWQSGSLSLTVGILVSPLAVCNKQRVSMWPAPVKTLSTKSLMSFPLHSAVIDRGCQLSTSFVSFSCNRSSLNLSMCLDLWLLGEWTLEACSGFAGLHPMYLSLCQNNGKEPLPRGAAWQSYSSVLWNVKTDKNSLPQGQRQHCVPNSRVPDWKMETFFRVSVTIFAYLYL